MEFLISKTAVVFDGDKGNTLSVSSKKRLKLIVPNRGDISSHKNMIGHTVTINNIARDTQPDTHSRGVVFVNTAHNEDECPLCIRNKTNNDKQKEYEKQVKYYTDNIDSILNEYNQLIEELNKAREEYFNTRRFKEKKLGKYSEKFESVFGYKIQVYDTLVLKHNTSDIGDIGYDYNINTNKLIKHITIDYKNVFSGTTISEDEYRTIQHYDKKPILSTNIVDNNSDEYSEIVNKYKDKISKHSEEYFEYIRYDRLKNKFNKNKDMFINKFNNIYDIDLSNIYKKYVDLSAKANLMRGKIQHYNKNIKLDDIPSIY